MNTILLSDGMTPDRIDPSARIVGQSLIAGEQTRIGPGVFIRDSYIKDYIIEEGTHIDDSVLVAGNPPWVEQLRTDFEAKWPTASHPPICRVGCHVTIEGSLLNCCAVGDRSSIRNSSCWGSTIGIDSIIEHSQIDGCTGQAAVNIFGPTEVTGSWLGHHLFINSIGCHNAIYSNDFIVVEYDETKGLLRVVDVIDIPHVSRYGQNLISSLHSGLIGPQPGGILHTLGRPQSVWGSFGNCLWYMGKNRFDPCCWIGGWTKVIGFPCQNTFRSYEDLLTKNTSTHILPFTVAGYESNTLTGQTLPGELNKGKLYKQRIAAWPFTYAPDSVIAMVQRVHAIVGKEIADRLVELTLRNALHFVRYLARQKNCRLDSTATGWSGWLGKSAAVIQAHIESKLWEFDDGEPIHWRQETSRWVPRDISRLLAIAPDAMDKRVSEEDILECPYPALERQFGPDSDHLSPTRQPTFIDPRSTVSPLAFIGPGVHIEGSSVVEDGAWLFRTVVKDSVVRRGVKIWRSVLKRSEVANTPEIFCGHLSESKLASKVSCKGFRTFQSDLSTGCRLDPFSRVSNSVISRGAIIGGIAENVYADANFFLVHPQGFAQYVKAVPSIININGKRVELHGLPMMGGGSRAFGTPDKPIQLECCFIGSNSILKAGVYVGVGCFVAEGLDEEEGLLPFTLSQGPGAHNDSLSAVLFQLPALVISSIINPTFNGCTTESRPFVAFLITEKIKEAMRAIEWVQSLRKDGRKWDEASPYAIYRNLRHYSDAQLANGMRGFSTALKDGRWQMEYRDGELRFCGPGRWIIEEGHARWQPA